MEEKPMKLEGMSGPDLVAVFNKIATLEEAKEQKARKVKKFRTREAGQRRLSSLLTLMGKDAEAIESLVALADARAVTKKKIKSSRKERYDDGQTVNVVKAQGHGRPTAAEKRWNILVGISNPRTVGMYLKAVSVPRNVGMGDLKYWSDKGRIRIE
jgi:hypothetical protein